MSPLSIEHNLMASGASRQLQVHYNTLADSVRRLSSGLRVEQAADDAAGLAIRELMRSDIQALGQGVRNANDAISLIQTADGALAIIDEKLIHMKELAEQAATGTYDSTQRLMIDSEFQQMAQEIDRIARATDFNGIHLLDGSLSGAHDGSGRSSPDGLSATGALKVHFGTANDSAEDYYYLNIGSATLGGLGLRDGGPADFGDIPLISDKLVSGQKATFVSGLVSFAVIPSGTTNLEILLNDKGLNDTIQMFTRDGKHLAGTTLDLWLDRAAPVAPGEFLSETNGFLTGATYDGSQMNGIGGNLTFQDENTLHPFTIDGMNFGYTGDGGLHQPGVLRNRFEKLSIDTVTEDLVILVAGNGSFDITASWGDMPEPKPQEGGFTDTGPVINIKTQERAQKAVVRVEDAIVRKDRIRAHLGATQNRLENTVTDLNVQAESLQAAESRISDVDVATEMTTFVRDQVLTRSATSILAQANTFPHILLRLLQG